MLSETSPTRPSWSQPAATTGKSAGQTGGTIDPEQFRPVVFSSLGATAADTTDPETSSARARGYASGYAAGRRAAEADVRAEREELQRRHHAAEMARQRDLAAAVATLNGAAVALHRRMLPVLEDASQLLAESALHLAQAVLGTELLDTEHGARAALARALAGVEAATVHAVHLHPEDLAALPAGLDLDGRINLVADPRLERGDAITEFEDGYLDARIGEALARCRAALQSGDT
ncbi:FliH/SctL family protein [Arthrobacter sp. JSM 101049]|uniref:FliH/SctL family protein n=1 Tax=Arthrobacter sp. JSM 101049 TaxID=929097 RepID=UPI0035646828